MIKYVVGDIIQDTSQCLVNTVNLEGVMGKGIAYQFKLKYPLNDQAYRKACKDKSINIGKVFIFEENGKLIANFPTKDKWRKPSQYTYIEKGLANLVLQISAYSIKSIAVPPLGCGNGGLDWSIIKELLEKYLNPISDDIAITIYQPSKYYKVTPVKMPKLNTSHLLLMRLKPNLNIFDKLRVQKTAFFFNLFSFSNYFKFASYKYGPYSHSIDILIKQIKEFQDYYQVETAEAEKIAYKNLISKSVETKLKSSEHDLSRALNFVNSINTNLELEIAATIIDIIQKNPICTKDKLLQEFHSYPKESPERITDNMIITMLDDLVFSNILIHTLFNTYEINTEYIKTSKTILLEHCKI